jgi:hypothetical protein
MAQPSLSTTFGQYIDTLVRLYAGVRGKGLTEYIKTDLSNDKNDAPNRLSSRQIARMRDIGADEFPEGKGLLKLLEALPSQLRILNPTDLCNRLLVPWEPVEDYQLEIVNTYAQQNLSIAIVAGRQAPLALSNSNVVAAMAHGIQKGTKYTFVYPNKQTYQSEESQDPEILTQNWLNIVQRRVVRHWEEQREREAVEKGLTAGHAIDIQALASSEELQRIEQTVQSSIRVVHTVLDTNFWFLLPSSYVVLYNTEPEYDGRELPQYGVFYVQGNSVIRSSLQQIEQLGYASTFSKGWLRIADDDYKLLKAAYSSIFPDSGEERIRTGKSGKATQKKAV